MSAREMADESLMAFVRRRRTEATKRKYRSPYFVTLPPPSELLLSESLAKLAEAMVRNNDFRKRILTAMNTIQGLLLKYPASMMGSFCKSLVRLRASIKSLPSEDVDPEYYSLMEDNLMDRFEDLQARIIKALAWERRRNSKKNEPIWGTADVKVIADTEHNIMTILINEHKTNVEFLFWGSIKMRNKLQKALEHLDKVKLPQSMITSIRKSFEQVIYCFSLEASVPYKLKDDLEDVLERLEEPSPLDAELSTKVKLLKVKAENCLNDSTREHESKMKALEYINESFETLDKILAETKRPYWMLDLPDLFENRKRCFKTELDSFTEGLRKKYNIIPEEERTGCFCYRVRENKKSPREIPLCPELMNYTEEVRKWLNVPPYPKDGKCYCSWLYNAPDCSGKGYKYGLDLRLYTTSIKNRARVNELPKDVTTCFCYWMKLQRAFGGIQRDSCLSQKYS